MGCGGSSLPAITEPSREAINAGGRRKSYNTGGNIFPKSARNKERMSSVDEEDENGNVGCKIYIYLLTCETFISGFTDRKRAPHCDCGKIETRMVMVKCSLTV